MDRSPVDLREVLAVVKEVRGATVNQIQERGQTPRPLPEAMVASPHYIKAQLIDNVVNALDRLVTIERIINDG